MANNRMYLVCPCGERFMVAKCLADNWYPPPGYQDYAGLLSEWFEAHRNCEPRVWGGTIMSLAYEQTEELPGVTRRPALTGEELAVERTTLSENPMILFRNGQFHPGDRVYVTKGEAG